MKEQIATEERARRLFEDQAGVPGMRNVRSIEMTHDLAPEIQHLLVGERARRTQRAVIEPGVAADDSVRRSRLRPGSEPLVERAALVRLRVAEGYPLEPFDVDDMGDSLGHRRE